MLVERLKLGAHRILAAIPLLFGISIVTFVILNMLPGNAAHQLLGADATPADIARMEALLGLDEPSWLRYGEWISTLLSGDWGRSLASGQPIADMLADRIFVTLELAISATALSLAIAVALALLASARPGGIADKLIFAASMALLSIPSYVLALLLVLVFSVHLELLPSIGYTPFRENAVDNLQSIALPVASIALPLTGLYGRFLRDDLVDQLSTEDYILTAMGKGLSRTQVLVNHTLRNSAPGLLTLVGTHFGTLVGGTVLVEQIFGLPGLGQLLFQATNTRDVAVVQAIVLLLGAITVLTNLVMDILCSMLDPRIDISASR